MALDYNSIAQVLQSWLSPGGPFAGAEGGPSFNPGGGVRGAHPLAGRHHRPAALGQPPTSPPSPWPHGIPHLPEPPAHWQPGIPPEPLTPAPQGVRPVLPQNQAQLQRQLQQILQSLRHPSGPGFGSFSGPGLGRIGPSPFTPPPPGTAKSDLPASAPGLFPSGSAPPQNSQEIQQMMQQLQRMLQQMGLGGAGQSSGGYPLANVADQQTGVFPSYQL